MRALLLLVFGGAGAAILAGCSTFAPEPCSSDWVKWRTDAITHDFRRDYGAEIRELAKFSRQLENPSPLILLQMSARLNDFQDMAQSFSQTVMPELRGAIDQCGTPTKFVSAFSGLLEEQGVDKTVLEWVNNSAALIERNLPPEPRT